MLVAELQKLTEVSITKAREALAASNNVNGVSATLKWLQTDLAISGAAHAGVLSAHPSSLVLGQESLGQESL